MADMNRVRVPLCALRALGGPREISAGPCGPLRFLGTPFDFFPSLALGLGRWVAFVLGFGFGLGAFARLGFCFFGGAFREGPAGAVAPPSLLSSLTPSLSFSPMFRMMTGLTTFSVSVVCLPSASRARTFTPAADSVRVIAT